MSLNELNQAMRQRLDALANDARNGDDQTVSEAARSQMPHLTETVQTLMAEHEPNERDRCPTCARIPPVGKQLPKAPCRVHLAARWALFRESAHHEVP